MAPTSPTVAGWELSIRIRERRKELGMDAQTVAKALGFSRNYWSAVENDRAILAEEKFSALAKLFSWEPEEWTDLRTLWSAARQKAWWHDPRFSLDDDLMRLYGLEDGASEERTFDALLMNGLLQTPEYIVAIAEADPGVSSVDTPQLLETRLRRQERLRRPDFHLTSLVSEAALHQQPIAKNGRKILLGQLKHVRQTIEDLKETLTVRVVPFSRGLGGLMSASSIAILSFENKLPLVVWQETGSALDFVEDERSRVHLKVSYERALEESLDRDASLAAIRHQIGELS